MDHSPIRQTFKFENNFSTIGKSFLNKLSEIVKFGCKILKKVKNIVMQSLRILYTFVLRGKKRYHNPT